MVLALSADVTLALWTGVIAAAAWSLLVIAWQWLRLWLALGAFVGTYDVRRKLRDDDADLGTVQIYRAGHRLKVALDDPRGHAEAMLALGERFPKTAHGAYEHRLNDGRVTTRYAHPAKQIEIVQGYEWRRAQASSPSTSSVAN